MTKNGETVRTITWTANPGVRVGPGEWIAGAVLLLGVGVAAALRLGRSG